MLEEENSNLPICAQQPAIADDAIWALVFLERTSILLFYGENIVESYFLCADNVGWPIRVLKSCSDGSLHDRHTNSNFPSLTGEGENCPPSASSCQVFQNLQLAWLFGHVHFYLSFSISACFMCTLPYPGKNRNHG